MEEILNLSTNFCEIISEKLLRDLVQCFVIEENRSCIILLYWDWSSGLVESDWRTDWLTDLAWWCQEVKIINNKLIILPIKMRAAYLLCWAALAALDSLASAQIRQYFIREPDNQTAIEGEQVSGCRGHDDGQGVSEELS